MSTIEIDRVAAGIPAGVESVRVTDGDGRAWRVYRDGSRAAACAGAERYCAELAARGSRPVEHV